MAREPVRLFLESAGKGPLAAAADETVEAAAAAFPRAHGAVQSIVAAVSAAGGGGGGGAEGRGAAVPVGRDAKDEGSEEGGGRTQNIAVGERSGEGPRGGDVVRVAAEAGADTAATASKGGTGAQAAEEVLAMERKDAEERAEACREAVGAWWERQRAAVEEGLQDREKEASDRR